MSDREMTPDKAQNIYMSIQPLELEELRLTPDDAKQYRAGIESISPQLGEKAPRLAALLDKLGESLYICLFAMPAEPWRVPATMFFHDRAGFRPYFDLVTSQFDIRHAIFRSGIKYSHNAAADDNLTIFLERRPLAAHNTS